MNAKTKMKINGVKKKLKEYAPTVVTAASIGAAIGLAIVNQQLKDKHAAYRKESSDLFRKWREFAATDQVLLSDEAAEEIKRTGPARFDNDKDDYYITLTVHDKTDED